MAEKRLGIFLFYDKDGVADRYIEYMLKDIRPCLDRLIVIANGKADENAVKMFESIADKVVIRENKGTMMPESRSVIFGGKDITKLPEHKRAATIGRVLQDPRMGTCGNLTVLENMALADNKNKMFGLGAGVNKKRTDYYKSLLETCGMGMENRMNVPVGNLSGGQRQAIALIIASMTDIDLLILDEHTAALDPKSSETLMKITDKVVKEKKVTTLMVTHDLRFAVEYGSRLVMMHEGKCVMDLKGEEKKNAKVDDLLSVFNEISIESGN